MSRESEGFSEKDLEAMGVKPEQMGIKKEFQAGGGGAESQETKRQRQIQEWSADLKSGGFASKPERYRDRGMVVDVLDENGKEIAVAHVTRDKDKVTDVNGLTFDELDAQGRLAKESFYDAEGNLHGTKEQTYEGSSQNTSTLELKDAQGRMVERQFNPGPNEFAIEYYDEEEKLAGKFVSKHDSVFRGQEISRAYYGPDGKELNLDRLGELDWQRKMGELTRRAY